MSEFSAAIVRSFEDLVAAGYVSIEIGAPDNRAFGNEVVLLCASNMRIRFVRDRGQEFVDIECIDSPGEWHPLERVLLALGIADYSEGLVDVDMAAVILRKHIRLIDERICDQETTSKLHSLGVRAKRRLLKKLKGDVD